VLSADSDGDEDEGKSAQVEIFLDRTPFYAEGGGQVGDAGVLETATGRAEVLDTTAALPGLHRHLAVVVRGTINQGQEVRATVEKDRRDAIRRNHTGTHLLHWALREVLGDHVKQAGSLVAPDRLRFDFSHYGPVTADQMREIEDLVNDRILDDEPVEATEMPKETAERLGAIAFFGDKYGEHVRVVRAGSRSMEFCGGTHVNALGMIGPVKVVSEGSIGSNLRRIEATTGTTTLDRMRRTEQELEQAAQLLRTTPEELTGTLERRLSELKSAHDELKALRQATLRQQAQELAAVAAANGGFVVARRDGLDQGQLRQLATDIRAEPEVRAVVLGGSPGPGKVSLVSAVAKGEDLVASDLIADAARIVGGGGGRQPDLAMAGGRDPDRLDEALSLVRQKLGHEPS
jgi:alanyl-tRNA synthetase